MSYIFKTYGREYRFELDDEGNIRNRDLGLSAPTVDALKALITEEVKKEKALPRIPIIFIEGRWDVITGYTRGSASAKSDRNGYRWVSYKHQAQYEKEPKTRRQMMGPDRMYLDTEQNIEFIEQAVQLGKEIAQLTKIQQDILSKMQKIGDVEE